jgi:para-aminobenzoate synthetase
VFGAVIEHAPTPVHGRIDHVWHDGAGLFAEVPQGFAVTRYHSLHVASPLPACLVRTAWTADGIIMGLRHRDRPLWGVQFHPESIGTEHGDQLLENFLALARAARPATSIRAETQWTESLRAATVVPHSSQGPSAPPARRESARFELRHRVLTDIEAPARVLSHLRRREAPLELWLDSSLVAPGVSRFSIFVPGLGPHGYQLSYRTEGDELRVTRGGETTIRTERIWDFLRRELTACQVTPLEDAPFDFACGFVGYIGYETSTKGRAKSRHRAPQPDVQMAFVDRALVVDHHTNAMWVLALCDRTDPSGEGSADGGDAWIAAMEERIRFIRDASPTAPSPSPAPHSYHWSRSRAQYEADIGACLEKIFDGETYEACLTNQLHLETTIDPHDCYLTLRRINPAPHAAWLRFDDLAIVCSSPERFVRVDRHRQVESKPIKGTAARGANPAADRAIAEGLRLDEKSRSENMMIVDLVRNDLGLVCVPGTVHVPHLMHVETYATVHQLVTTVRGTLRLDATVIDCLEATFPGGSMTGAPKKRTMEILETLEAEARGVYSGCIGYLSLDGAADFNIAIRTAVFRNGHASIGVGGAIVALSNRHAELEEMRLKARALLRALLVTAHGHEDVETELRRIEQTLE